jgi:hypothetical protein
MRQLAIFVLLAVPAILPAQQNPFKPPKPAVQKFEVTSILTGDMKGNVLLAMDGDRMVRVSADTMKMMGKTSHNSTWNLTTPDSVWHADLAKKTGTVSPNMLPYMAEAYDNLDGDGKKRFTQNIADLATMMSKAFNIGQINSGEKLGTKTYAGHECEERKFGGFTVCQIEKTPIVLHTAGKLLCLNFEETATSVRLGSASPALFNPPADVKFQSDTSMSRPDSVANGFVGYRAKRHTGVIDIDRRGGYAVDEFWEPIARTPSRGLVLNPDDFYILASRKLIRIPPHFADRKTACEDQVDFVQWWSEIFELPCVAFEVETCEQARLLIEAGADFIAVRLPSDDVAVAHTEWLDELEGIFKTTTPA